MNMDDIFLSKTTQRHDYTTPHLEDVKRYHQWNSGSKSKEKILRQKPYQPLYTHTMRPWVDPVQRVPFDLMWQTKDIIRSHPQAKFGKCTEPSDPLKEEAIRTRPRLYMSPAVSMDDIQEKEVRDLLTRYMYSTVFQQATEELNLKANQREIPNTCFEKCVDQVRGTYSTFKHIPSECRAKGKEWETGQYTSLVDPCKRYWSKYVHASNTVPERDPFEKAVSNEVREEIRNLVERDGLRMPYDKLKPGYSGYVPRNVIGPFRKQELAKE